MERYNKFLVEKWSDVEKYLTFDQQLNLHGLLQLIASGRERDGKSDKNYVVVADDWPMYETVWSLIEAFVDNSPNEIEALRARVAELEAEAGKWRVLHKAVSVALEAAHNREARSARLEAQKASEPHPPTRHCTCDDCKPSFEEASEPVALETVYETIIQWDEGGGKRSRRDLARRIVDLYTTPQPTKQEASEPVCWITPDGVGWRMRFEPPVNDVPLGWTPLYETPQPTPTVQAAVAAAYRKAAEVCQIVMQAKFEGGTAHDALEAILSIPSDDSALREICLRVAEEVNAANRMKVTEKLSDIVDRVLDETNS